MSATGILEPALIFEQGLRLFAVEDRLTLLVGLAEFRNQRLELLVKILFDRVYGPAPTDEDP